MTRFQKQLAHWYPVVFLLIFFALALETAVSKSFTMDEPVHILRGAALWQTGDTRLQYEHTPLSHWAIGSLLPLAKNLPPLETLPDWETVQHIPLTEQFLWQANPSPNLNVVGLLARLPVIFAGLFLGAVLVRWGKDSLSLIGQMVVMVFYAFSPNLLAHLSLATTDGMLTAVYLITVFALWRFWQRPGWLRWLLVGILLGLALTTKLTALVLLPLGFFLSYASYFQGKTRNKIAETQRFSPTKNASIFASLRLQNLKWWQPGLIWLSILPIAGFTVWAVYGFELRPLPWLTVPLPAATYFNSLRDLLLHSGEGHIGFLQGERSFDGWWNYFLVAFSVKTPAVVLALFGVTVVRLTRYRRWWQTVYWWLSPLILFVVASFGGLNIGYRHILPVLPFVWLLVGAAFVTPETAVYGWQKRWQQVVLVGLLGWYVFASVRQSPDYLAYFNEFIGGSTQGVYHLSDSNLDWGQDLPLLVDYLAENPEAQFSYFGPGDPAWAGVAQRPLTESTAFSPANPAAGQYAISTSHIQGIQLDDWDLFDWFRRQEPMGNLGHSILLYEVEARREGSWVAQCLDPGAILEETAVSQILGIADYRSVFFDCTNSWVFPNAGEAGWYILPQRPDWPLVNWLPDNLTLVYKHDASGESPSYTVYYWDGQTEPAQAILPENQQSLLAAGTPSPLPVAFGGTASLLGYRLDGADWWTGWQVDAETAVPLTVAGHLYAGEPTPIVADGLGFTSDQWQPGDIFLQRFAYEQAGDFLETGLYNYVSGEKLAVEDGAVGFVRLLPESSTENR